MADYLANLLSDVVGIARDYVGGGVRVSVKTNYTGEVPIAAAAMGSGAGGGEGGEASALSRLLGVKAAVIVRSARGDVLATFGTPPPADPLRVAVGLVVAGGLLWLLYRGATR